MRKLSLENKCRIILGLEAPAILVSMIMAVLILAEFTTARILNVPLDYATIQAGIDAALPKRVGPCFDMLSY